MTDDPQATPTPARNTYHLVTVGVSLIEERTGQTSETRKAINSLRYAIPADARAALDRNGTAHRQMPDHLLGLEGDEHVGAARSSGRTDQFPQELSYLHLYYAAAGRAPGDDRLLLFASGDDRKEGGTCARIIEAYVKQAKFHGGAFKEDNVRVVALDIDFSRETELTKDTLDTFAREIHQIATDPQFDDWELLLNFTGGYKGLIPYAVALAAIYPRLQLRYLYASAQSISHIPQLPVAFDAATWRDARALVRAVDRMDDHAQRQRIVATLPPLLQPLFDRDGHLGFLGRALSQRFSAARADLLDLHGPGQQMFQFLDSDRRKLCPLEHWRHAATGDKVPEMVEHGRGHVQRVQEIMTQIVAPLQGPGEPFFNQEELLALTAAVWLHDTGHAAEYLDLAGLPKPWNEMGPAGLRYPVMGFPTLSRDFHHLLTASLLWDEQARTGYGIDGWQEDRLRALTAVCLYHRREMPLQGTGKLPDRYRDLGIGKIPECPKQMTVNGQPVRTRLLAALYSLCDGLDLQLERAYSDDEIALRREALRREVAALFDRLAAWRPWPVPALAGLAADLLEKRNEVLAYVQRPESDTGSMRAYLKKADRQIGEQVYCFWGTHRIGGSSPDLLPDREALSLLDRLQFKARQSGFYYHHRGLAAVYACYLGKSDGEHRFDVRAVHAPDMRQRAIELVFGSNGGKEGTLQGELERARPVFKDYGLSFTLTLEEAQGGNP